MTPVMPVSALGHGELAACRVDGVEVVVCQVEGQYFALANRCSHAGQPLSAGRLEGHELVCPLHRARFDVRTGAALGPPASAGIPVYPLEIASGRVCVAVSGR